MLRFHSRAALLPVDNVWGLPPSAGRLLSNFASGDIVLDGVVYPTAEHAFQAAKYRYSTRPELSGELFMNRCGPDPADAKRLGSRKGMEKLGARLDVSAWEVASLEEMRRILEAKASQHPDVAECLRSVKKAGGELTLVHFSLRDTKWGAFVRRNGTMEGSNLMGRLWTEIASVLA